jgi:hypothetical protein
VDLAFCGCSKVGHHGTRVQQLLRRRLFPATTLDPQTACTFALLKSAQLLSLQSKLSLYDYYICVEKLTDATGTAGVNVSYHFGRLPVNLAHPLKGQVQGVPPSPTNVAPSQDAQTRWPVVRRNWSQWYVSWGACRPVPSVPHPDHQSTTRLEIYQ